MHTASEHGIYQPLRFTYGLVPILAGLDKFTNLLTDWEAYLHPAAAALLPVSPGLFMRTIGLVEIAVGVLVLTRFTRIGAYAAMAWLALIAAQLAALGLYDVAVRDLVMAVGAYTLARMTEERRRATEHPSIGLHGTLEQAGAR